MIAAWSLLHISFTFAIAGWSTGAASTPAPSRVELDDVFATMRSMTVLTLPQERAEQESRVRFDPHTRTVEISLDGTSEAWQQELLERATGSPQIGAVTWREKHSVLLWLRSMRVDAALVNPNENGPTQLVLGEPRQRRNARFAWFGDLCIASSPKGEHPVYKQALRSSCARELGREELHKLTSAPLDEVSSRARELLLAELEDLDALSREQLLENNPTARGFRAQVYLSMALDALERDELERALEPMLEAARSSMRRSDLHDALSILDERDAILNRLDLPLGDSRQGQGMVLRSKILDEQGHYLEARRWAASVVTDAAKYGWRQLGIRLLAARHGEEPPE